MTRRGISQTLGQATRWKIFFAFFLPVFQGGSVLPLKDEVCENQLGGEQQCEEGGALLHLQRPHWGEPGRGEVQVETKTDSPLVSELSLEDSSILSIYVSH